MAYIAKYTRPTYNETNVLIVKNNENGIWKAFPEKGKMIKVVTEYAEEKNVFVVASNKKCIIIDDLSGIEKYATLSIEEQDNGDTVARFMLVEA